jgi:hypothetical protein
MSNLVKGIPVTQMCLMRVGRMEESQIEQDSVAEKGSGYAPGRHCAGIRQRLIDKDDFNDLRHT